MLRLIVMTPACLMFMALFSCADSDTKNTKATIKAQNAAKNKIPKDSVEQIKKDIEEKAKKNNEQKDKNNNNKAADNNVKNDKDKDVNQDKKGQSNAALRKR